MTTEAIQGRLKVYSTVVRDWSSRRVMLLCLPVISRVLVAVRQHLLSCRTGNATVVVCRTTSRGVRGSTDKSALPIVGTGVVPAVRKRAARGIGPRFQVQMCHRARIPAGPAPSPGKVRVGRSRTGNLGSACRSVFRGLWVFGGAGFSDLLRSHRGSHWAIVITVS